MKNKIKSHRVILEKFCENEYVDPYRRVYFIRYPACLKREPCVKYTPLHRQHCNDIASDAVKWEVISNQISSKMRIT